MRIFAWAIETIAILSTVLSGIDLGQRGADTEGKGFFTAQTRSSQSFTKAGMPVGIADGSVRILSPDLTPMTWNAAVQPNDGQVLGPDWGN